MLFLLLAAVLGQHSLMPGAGQRWSYDYSSGEDAEAACVGEGKLLCTKTAFFGACAYDASQGTVSDSTDYNSVGWFKEAGGYSRGSQSANCVFSSWAPTDDTGTAHCCEPTYHNSGYYVVASPFEVNEAEAYCEGTNFPNVCSVRQVRGISEDGESADQGSVSSIYSDGSVGWYSGSQQRWDGLTGWPASRGAHCCSDYAGYQSFTIPNYAVLPESKVYTDSNYWNGDVADQACLDAGYDGLCTVAQQAQAANDGANVCFVGWVKKTSAVDSAYYTPGYYGYSECGNPGIWNDDYNPYSDTDGTYPGAHCCKSAQTEASIGFPVYQTLKQSYQWDNADDAELECLAYGSEYSLCSRGQLKKVATESFSYNGYDHTAVDNMCSLGWTREASGSSEMTWYQASASEGCGAANSWEKIAGAQVASFHCCQDFDADDIPTPVYETLKWAHFNYEDAEDQCRDGMDLCTRDQLALVAREDVEYMGETQTQISDMCSQGWTKDGGLGWWQVEETPGCFPTGLDMMNAFTASTGTYHCCAPFDAPSSTTPYETRQWFYYTYDEAAGMCGTGAQLCSQEQVHRVATEGVTYNGMTVDAQINLCSQGWFLDGTMGWWQEIEGCGDTEAQTLASFTADTATFHCCLPFEGLELPTAAPESSDAPETTTTTETPDETDVSLNMPSAVPQPDGCVAWDYAPVGFEDEVSYCVSDGIVYLDGHSTCVLADGDGSTVNAALESSWNNDWFFGASQDCTGRSVDATTSDQLWVTNKMCDNLEAEIESTQEAVTDYLDSWKESLTELVNTNLQNFDAETQAQLTELLNSMNGN